MSIDRKSIALLDVTLINSPREVWEDPAKEGGERTLVGWEADMDYMSCAEPATLELAKTYFRVLGARLQYEPDEDEMEAAYARAFPPPAPHEPRKFSVKAVAAKIRELGYTAQVREALMGVDGYEMYVGANYLKEDDEDFQAMKELVKQVTGLGDDEIEAVLKDCIWEA